MQRIQDYEILEKLGETRWSLVYRGRKEGRKDTVVLKMLNAHSPSASEIARFKQEYEIIKSLDIDGIIKIYDILIHEGVFVLVLEDFNGVSLNNLLDEERVFDIKSFLGTGIKVSEALGELHKRNIIHKDIKPSNILLNREDGRVKITDFGISSVLTHESEIYNPDIVQGTLLYLSPEQTGRMNRVVDYRTDLYSLGVTFYKMLTGTMPFESSDPLEIIYSHIAKEPVPPIDRRSDIPEIISNIIIKLMSKNAEDRYQNAFGLAADLNECLGRLNPEGRIKPFELGKHDVSSRFIIPQKLFGREREIDIIESAFERISGTVSHEADSGGVELVFIVGSPGIGKSALINEISKPVVERNGYFLSGKYEQFRNDTPYSAIIQAFQKLSRQILAGSLEKITEIKKNILDTLGSNGRIITDIIPELEKITGKQPETAKLGPNEERNRFNIVFERFVGVFAKKEHPMVLFLDDMRWADLASLQFIGNLVLSPDIKYMLIIGSYRNNEVFGTHPLIETIEYIERAGSRINRITLSELTENDIKDLIVNFLKCTEERGNSLAKLIFRKTGGNPFFVKEFLYTLYNDKLLELDSHLGWRWDIEKISRISITDNVVEFLSGKINKLPERMREILKICACIGNRFDLETLSFLLGKSIEETLPVLTEAINEGFIGGTGDIYVFNHDRIQESVYSLIPDEEKPSMHYRIGKLALERTDAGKLQNRLFYIVDQLNLGSGLISDSRELEELARLNYLSGKKAKASAAFSSALRYFETGMSLLGSKCWGKQYDLALSIHIEAAEAAYLKADYDAMNIYADIVFGSARNIYDKIPVYETKITAFNVQSNFQASIDIALEALKKLNYSMPAIPGKFQIMTSMIKIKFLFSSKKINSLIDHPEMTDPHYLAVLQILSFLGKGTFYIAPDLFLLTTIKMAELSMKYGNCSIQSYNYIGMAIILSNILGDIEAGYKLGNLALKLGEKLKAHRYEAQTLFVYYYFIAHWKEHLKSARIGFNKSYYISLETGDIELISFNIHSYDCLGLHLGIELTDMEQQMSKTFKTIEQYKQSSVLGFQSIIWQTVLNLLGKSESPVELRGTALDEEHMIPLWKTINARNLLVNYYIYRLMLRYLFYEYRLAVTDSDTSIIYLNTILGIIESRDYFFYSSLSRLALYSEVSMRRKLEYKKFVRQSLKRFKKWTKHAPMNNEHRMAIIQAEEARVLGKSGRAERLYDNAIELCKKNEYLIEEAIADELAGKYYLSKSKLRLAKIYMSDAYACYARWGAEAKLKQMQRIYPELIPQVGGSSRSVSDSGSSTGTASQIIDLTSVVRASQVISGEVVLRKLLEKMMKIVMENAGAQKGFLILEDKGNYLVEAEGTAKSEKIKVLNSIPVDAHRGLCASIVSYVARTNEMLILNDASSEGDFTGDPYVQENNPKSILCAPIINQGRLTGIIYLENNLSAGAFTQERLEILNILSSQMAISIENAKFYEKLEEKVQGRTIELKKSEKRFMDIALSSADWIWEINKKGVYTYCSGKVEDILGYRPEEIIGKTIFDSMLPEETERLKETYARIGKNRENIKDLENWHLTKDGKRICLLVNGIPVFDDRGNLAGYRGIDKDITERKKLEDALRKSEEQYRMLAENMTDVITISDMDGKPYYISPAIERETGYKPEEYFKLPIEKHHPKEYVDLLVEKFNKITDAVKRGIRGIEERFEVVVLRKDGTSVQTEMIFTEMYNKQGEVVGVQGVSRNITERKKLEEALRKSEEQYRMLAENMTDVVSISDLNGKNIYLSPSIQRQTGYTALEWMNMELEETHSKESAGLIREKVFKIVDSAKSGIKGMGERCEVVTKHKNGTAIQVEIILGGMYNSQGELMGIQGVSRDITERKKAEMKLKELMEELSRSNKELEEFAYIVSHDLQEPLRKVITFGNRLKENIKDKMDEKSADYIGRMQNAAKRMQDLILGLLNYSRVTTKTRPFEEVDLNMIVNDVVTDLEERIREKGGRIEIGEFPLIHADALQMRQLFQNLIGNALKFHKPGEQPVVKIFGLEDAPGNYYHVVIEDNGIGIDKKDNEKIFGVFQRLHARSEFEGSGIGLAVCRKIMERHGGTIGLESKLGKGTRFIIDLPVNQPTV